MSLYQNDVHADVLAIANIKAYMCKNYFTEVAVNPSKKPNIQDSLYFVKLDDYGNYLNIYIIVYKRKHPKDALKYTVYTGYTDSVLRTGHTDTLTKEKLDDKFTLTRNIKFVVKVVMKYMDVNKNLILCKKKYTLMEKIKIKLFFLRTYVKRLYSKPKT